METERKKKPTHQSSVATDMPLPSLPGVNGQMLEAMAEASENCIRGVSALIEEWACFMSRRVREDTALAQSCRDCDDWSKLAKVQRDWARQTFEEYSNETQKLTRMGTEVLMEGITPFYDAMRPNGKSTPH